MSLAVFLIIFSAFSISIHEVTSRSIYVRWSKFSGAFSYKITATPVNIGVSEPSFAQFNDITVIGTLNTLIPNTLYSIKVEAMDQNGLSLAQDETVQLTAPEVPAVDKAYSKLSDSITVEWADVPGVSSYLVTARDGASSFETIVSQSPGTVSGLQPATWYKITVRSINAAGKSQPSCPQSTQTVLAAAVISVTSPSINSLEVSWDPVNGSAGYTVSIMRSDGLGTRLTLNTTDTSLNFTGLDPGTMYTIKVQAFDANGTPGDDATASERTGLEAPTDVQVTFDSGALAATVSWAPTEGATDYTAIASTGDGDPPLNCTSVSTACTISPLQCGKEYLITLVANNDGVSSVPSDAVTLKTVPCAPAGITISEGTPGNLTVSWSDVQLRDYYVVFVKRDDGLEVHCNTSQTQCYFQSDCGFTYFISVFAYNSAGQSPPGDVFNYTTAPCCPSDFGPAFVSSDTLEIVWSPVRGAEMYEAKVDDGTHVMFCNDTATVCALSALQCNSYYNVTVYSYNEIRGKNASCASKAVMTAPCSPEINNLTRIDPLTYDVHWASNNDKAVYSAHARGDAGDWNCNSSGSFCTLSGLPCGSFFLVNVIASTALGQSLPSYSAPLETAPCCPEELKVVQVTQSMTNVSWSVAAGAQTYATMLESPRGQAKCHTLENHCLLGCITCGTNYSVSLQAISETGLASVCTFQGYSSSACCPSGVRLYRLSNSGIRVNWRTVGGAQNYSADLYGSKGNFTCTPSVDFSYCDVTNMPCEDTYNVVVAPVANDGSKLTFCPKKIYSVTCSGSSIGTVIYRGKRSAE
ncbi:fibronectin type III domain-containing protein 7-like [Rhinatrema bivittatum]|uniref:fibronectin type III domain-containing protein 7-like n=1 Tax=Rhinatrema bivittatum TaxID=194408 RepID=UPI0011261DD2|nr:fibronectin type III domain-containing protein 7-like [Rhinatrema bivittatum]